MVRIELNDLAFPFFSRAWLEQSSLLGPDWRLAAGAPASGSGDPSSRLGGVDFLLKRGSCERWRPSWAVAGSVDPEVLGWRNVCSPRG